MKNALIYIIWLILLSCNEPRSADTASTTLPGATDTVQQLSPEKYKIVNAYSMAIRKYVELVYKNKTLPDTLYIGKHQEFPDIPMPPVIGYCHVRLLTFDDLKSVPGRENAVYLNIFSWLTDKDAEFMIVELKGGRQPQHNCRINLGYDTEREDYVLNSISLEDPYNKRK